MDLGLPLRKAVSLWGTCVPTLFREGRRTAAGGRVTATAGA
jgi:hypothetical protein